MSIYQNKVFIGYSRISSKDQSNFSLEGQRAGIERFVAKHNATLLAFFEDDGRSGKSFDRPDWEKLEEFVKGHYRQIDFFVVMKFDRFSRNLREALNKIEELEIKYKIIVISVLQQISLHPKNPGYFEFRTQKLLSAHSERLAIAERTKIGMRDANSTGQWVNKPPYGYEKIVNAQGKRTMRIIEHKAAHIRRIFELFLLGNSYKEIGSYMKREGFTQRHRSYIQRILKNHAYAGLVKVVELYDEPEQMITGLHPAIIEPATFYKVQHLMQPRSLNKSSINDNFPLRGVLRCELCQRHLTAAFSKGKKMLVGYYFCTKDRRYNHNAKKIHNTILEILQELSLPAQHIQYIRESLYQSVSGKLKNNEATIQEKQSQLREIVLKESRLQDAYLEQIFTPDQYKEKSKQLVAERSGLQQIIQQLKEPVMEIWQRYEQEIERLGDIKKVFELADSNQKQQLIRVVFEDTLTYFNGMFRTRKILPLFALKAASLQEKRLLIFEQPMQNFQLLESSTPNGQQFEPIQALLAIFSQIKVA